MDFEKIADEMSAPQDLLQQVSELAEQQVELEKEIAAQNEKLKQLTARLNRISSIDLPAAMQSAGLVSLGMKDGSTIKVESGVAASITEATADAAFKWLHENGHDDLIKNTVQVGFGKGDEERAAALVDLLEANGYDEFTIARKVHPQTLKAFVREQVEKGVEIPAQPFNLYPYTITKIVKPKK